MDQTEVTAKERENQEECGETLTSRDQSSSLSLPDSLSWRSFPAGARRGNTSHNALCNNIWRLLRLRYFTGRQGNVRSVFISWLLPCCLSAPPLATGLQLGDVRLSGRGASRSSSLLLLSSLPEALAESEELLPVLLICSITSTSARNSGGTNTRVSPLFIAAVWSWGS